MFISIFTISLKRKKIRARDTAELVEYLSRTHEAQSLIPSTAQNENGSHVGGSRLSLAVVALTFNPSTPEAEEGGY